jgi:hypothetical protein
MIQKDILSMDDIASWTQISYVSSPLNLNILDWCRSYDSKHQYGIGMTGIWFSSPEDAIIFSLTCIR